MASHVRIIILGTAGAVPSETASLPAIMLHFEGNQVLFDCGEDVQRQFLKANLKFNVPLVICISHMHGDHVIGLPGLLFNFNMGDRTAPLTIVGPQGIFSYLHHLHDDIGLRVECPLEVREIQPDLKVLQVYTNIEDPILVDVQPIEKNVVFRNKLFAISAMESRHSVFTLAYCIQERPLFGTFHPDMAKLKQVPEGPLWKKLQRGKSVEINGKVLDPVVEGIVEPPMRGRTIIYTGDTMPGPDYSLLSPSPDVLIHESMYLNQDAKLAEEKQHSTSQDAARVASRIQAKYLLLTHRSSRYKDPSAFLAEAQSTFPNTILAKDLDVFELKKTKVLEKNVKERESQDPAEI